MEGKQPRKRIPIAKRGIPVIEDEMAFVANKSSSNARIITTIDERIGVKIWFDKHYLDRHQHGDERGKRIGIDTSTVESLVINCIKHLLLYGSYVKNFTFLNNGKPISGRSLRVVCQQETKDGKLNVIIEAHFISLYEYEITVITAICKEDFEISDGQYAIELTGKDNSTLRFNSRGRINEVFSI